MSLCAMCSHNEAAVRWNRTSSDDNIIDWPYIHLTYDCTIDLENSISSSDDVCILMYLARIMCHDCFYSRRVASALGMVPRTCSLNHHLAYTQSVGN